MLHVPEGPWVGDTITAQIITDTLLNRRGPGHANPLQEMRSSGVSGVQQVSRAVSAAENREQCENSPLPLQPTPQSRDLSLDIQQLVFPNEHFIRNAASDVRSWAHVNTFSGQDFLVVEWREYDPRRGEDSKAALQARIEGLVRMLKEKPRSDSFRVFDCVGYFLDNAKPRFGITFRFPTDYRLQQDPAPMSLFEMTGYSKDVPYLGELFRLAYLLAESLHGLHAAGWLHKSICSRNILLFRLNQQPAIPGRLKRPVSLESPYFTGFAMSRPDGPAIDSSLTAHPGDLLEFAIYRHVEVQGLGGRAISRYRSIYDIYSLGIVLLEIGTWQTVGTLYPSNPAPNFNFSQLLLQKVVPLLGGQMGENYMNVVRKCLEGNFGRLSGFTPDDYESLSYKDNVRQGLLWEVVNVLRECRA